MFTYSIYLNLDEILIRKLLRGGFYQNVYKSPFGRMVWTLWRKIYLHTWNGQEGDSETPKSQSRDSVLFLTRLLFSHWHKIPGPVPNGTKTRTVLVQYLVNSRLGRWARKVPHGLPSSSPFLGLQRTGPIYTLSFFSCNKGYRIWRVTQVKKKRRDKCK